MAGVIVTIQVKKGMDEAFKADMKAMAEIVAANEPGFLYGDLYSTNYPGKYMFLEVYKDQESLQLHAGLPHTAEFSELKKRWEESIEVHKIYPVLSGGPAARDS